MRSESPPFKHLPLRLSISLFPLRLAEEPLLAQGDAGRAFQGLRRHSEGICFGLKHPLAPHRT